MVLLRDTDDDFYRIREDIFDSIDEAIELDPEDALEEEQRPKHTVVRKILRRIDY